MLLLPGIYISRKSKVGDNIITTFDIRLKRPNFENAMTPEEAHTIEHIGATYLRNDERIKDDVIYFGPAGCLTSFYLVLAGNYDPMTPDFMSVVTIIRDMLRCVAKWTGEIPGASAVECGNYKMNDLEGAKNVCANMLVLMEDLCVARYEYPKDPDNTENEHYVHDDVDEDDIDEQVHEESTDEPVKNTTKNVSKNLKNNDSSSETEQIDSSILKIDYNELLKPVDYNELKNEIKKKSIEQVSLF